MKINFAEPSLPDGGTLVVAAFAGRKLSPAASALDKQTGGALGRAVAASPKFKGGADELATLVTPPELSVARIVVIGLGEAAQVGDAALQRAGGTLAAHLNSIGETTAAIQVDGVDAKKVAPAQAAAEIAFGATLRSYRFDKYKTTQKPEAKPTLEKLTVLTADPTGARRAWTRLSRVAEGVAFTRDLVSEPPNILYPVSFAERVAELAELGLEVEVLDEKKLKKLGMGALLGVGQGSVHESRVVVMQWNGAPKGKDPAPVAFVGKGVTFDTGGISIKPAAGMEDMKWDMAGAGAVTGLMRALAGRKARVNAVGIIGLVENMPSGTAQRPGDIVTSMSGQTIEVLNTDAEGRLVLADALWYTQDRFKPRFMVDLATLTGAIMIALGTEYAGLFSNDEELAARLIAAGNSVGEKLWRMPLGDAYNKAIDSDAADVKNIAGDRNAGSSIGAVFLERFVNKLPWAHLDIAGMAWSKKDAPTVPKGATGYGVRLLDRLVADHYES